MKRDEVGKKEGIELIGLQVDFTASIYIISILLFTLQICINYDNSRRRTLYGAPESFFEPGDLSSSTA